MRSDSAADPVSSPSAAVTSSPGGLQRPHQHDDIVAASSMTSTLALLPSSPLDPRRDNVYTSGLSYQRPPLARSQSSPHKPQLSLNTSSCSSWRVIGKGNTGLRLDELSANSPTVQNTYKNGYDAARAPPGTPAVLREPGTPAGVTRTSHSAPSTPHPRIDSPASSSTSVSLPSLSSGSSQSSAVDMDLDAAKAVLFGAEVPYVRNPGLHPILSNTPLPSKHVCTPRTAARRHHRRPNSVSFRPSLTEEIRTTNYVAKHSDLLEKPSATAKSPRGEKRESPDSELQSSSGGESSGESDEQGESCPKTPVAGRRKRRREWVWTLGTLEGVPCRTPDTPDPGPASAVVAKPNWGNGEPVLEAPRLAMPIPRRRAS